MGKPKKETVQAEAANVAPPTPVSPDAEQVTQSEELDVNRPFTLEDLHNSKKIKSPFTFYG